MASFLAANAEAAHDLPMPAGAYGLIALGGFAVLLAVTLAFRNVGNRH